MKLLIFIFLFIIFFLFSIRVFDQNADWAEWNRLKSIKSENPLFFNPSMVSTLPEPARRYFNFTIQSGTALLRVAEIEMEGLFSLGTKEKPNYQTMQARQTLAAPFGFLWQLFLPGLVPISFWTPAALLPSEYVSWEGLSDHSSRVIIKYSNLIQSIDIEVENDGRPKTIHFMRWSNANAEKVYRLQPFGGFLSEFHNVQGFTIPFEVEAGNMYGTAEYFPFFKAKLKSVQFF